MNYSVDFAYRYTRKSGEHIHSHRHNGLEVVYYADGCGKTVINNREYSFNTGDFAVIRPFSLHEETHISDCDVVFAAFCFGEDAASVPEGVFGNGERICRIIESVYDEAKNQRAGFRRMLGIKAQEMFIELSRIGCEENSVSKDFGFVVNYILENYAQKIDYRMLAGFCCYSYDYFRHAFKASVGMSPREFHISTRLDRARNQLSQSDSTVTEISENCGFSTNAQFSRMFRSKFGQTPLEYRKSSRRTG